MMIDKTLCNGCWACVNICNQNAIKMNEDTEGFMYPVIDTEKCNNCGKCNKACPALKKHFKPKRSHIRKGIAVRSDKYAPGSTSGGAFALMANKVLSMGGYVAGAVFNDEWKVEHIVSNKIDDVNKMRGSKYLQSNINTSYRDTKSLLDNGKYVLFSGTPCQIAGLYGFLGKDYENLLTVDLICHGVNSPMIWKKYLDELTGEEKVSYVVFRNKAMSVIDPNYEGGGGHMCSTIRLENGKEITKTWAETEYATAFLQNLSLRPCCGFCQYAGRIRPGDITIGDLWANNVSPENRRKGISQILLNNKKGKRFFAYLENDWSVKNKINLNETKYSNPNINGYSSKHHPYRNRFFNLIKIMSLKNAVDYTINKKYNIAVLGMRGYNYGNQLTSYAMYQVLTEMGQTVLMLDRPCTSLDKPLKNPFNNFQQIPYPDYAIAGSYPDKESMKELNNRIGIFLLPSDQVLRPCYVIIFDRYTLMDWVRDDKPKISYASSFGDDSFEEDDNFRAEMGFYLNRFDAISVREDSAVSLIKENFNLDAEQVLDPVFLCNFEIYKNLAMEGKARLPKKPFLGGYILDPSEERAAFLQNLLLSLNLDKYCIMIDANIPAAALESSIWGINHLKNATVEEFIACIDECEYFVTDSFHGICFSIIFKKQFIVIYNEKQNRGSARISSFLKKINLEKRFVDDINKIDTYYILQNPINYDEVYNILNSEIIRSRTWLKNTLDKVSSLKKNKSVYDIMDDKFQEIEKKYAIIYNNIWLYRKIKGFFRCIKQHGVVYTIKLFIKKTLRFLKLRK